MDFHPQHSCHFLTERGSAMENYFYFLALRLVADVDFFGLPAVAFFFEPTTALARFLPLPPNADSQPAAYFWFVPTLTIVTSSTPVTKLCVTNHMTCRTLVSSAVRDSDLVVRIWRNRLGRAVPN